MSFQGQIDNILSTLAFCHISHGINAYRFTPFLSVGVFLRMSVIMVYHDIPRHGHAACSDRFFFLEVAGG